MYKYNRIDVENEKQRESFKVKYLIERVEIANNEFSCF